MNAKPSQTTLFESTEQEPIIRSYPAHIERNDYDGDDYWSYRQSTVRGQSYADYLKCLGASNAVEALEIVVKRNRLFRIR